MKHLIWMIPAAVLTISLLSGKKEMSAMMTEIGQNAAQPQAAAAVPVELPPQPLPPDAAGALEDPRELAARIQEADANLERSGLLSKARAAALSEEEEKHLAKYMEAVLQLRDREIQIRIRELQARLDKAGS